MAGAAAEMATCVRCLFLLQFEKLGLEEIHTISKHKFHILRSISEMSCIFCFFSNVMYYFGEIFREIINKLKQQELN